MSEDILEAIKREIFPLPLPKAAQDYSDKEASKLLAKERPGDEIWWFRTPDDYGVLVGGEGYVLVRDGIVVDVITTWIFLV